jgi:FkbM family methyltransferase
MPPTLTTVPLDYRGRKISSCFPNSGNMTDHLRSILSGKDYPPVPLPVGYKVSTIVDVGANVGAAALWFLSAAEDARLVCFEPSKQNFDCLRQNLQPFPAAEIYCVGLFARDKTVATLHLGASQCMQHSIVASCETGDATETISLKRASAEFDRLGLKEISILKIDTEGCEVPILEDLGRNRLSRVDVIYLEWHSEEDRREIDSILAEQFMMVSASVNFPHRGNAAFLAKRLANSMPKIAGVRIERPHN